MFCLLKGLPIFLYVTLLILIQCIHISNGTCYCVCCDRMIMTFQLYWSQLYNEFFFIFCHWSLFFPCYRFWQIIMTPKGGHIVISVSVRSSVRSSFRPFVLPSVRPSVRSSFRPFVLPSVRPSVRSSFRPFVTDYFCWRVVVCVRFSSETTRPISPMMIPINWGNNVDVQRALHFDLDPLHDCRLRSRNTSILWIIFADG